MKRKRQSTLEPVFGTLTQFMGLRKINTIGIAQANKVMHLSAIAYNLKKYLKFINKTVKSGASTQVSIYKQNPLFLERISVFLKRIKLNLIPSYKTEKPLKRGLNEIILCEIIGLCNG
jgi:hypothetical protein